MRTWQPRFSCELRSTPKWASIWSSDGREATRPAARCERKTSERLEKPKIWLRVDKEPKLHQENDRFIGQHWEENGAFLGNRQPDIEDKFRLDADCWLHNCGRQVKQS
jgi:hypothetical protein